MYYMNTLTDITASGCHVTLTTVLRYCGNNNHVLCFVYLQRWNKAFSNTNYLALRCIVGCLTGGRCIRDSWHTSGHVQPPIVQPKSSITDATALQASCYWIDFTQVFNLGQGELALQGCQLKDDILTCDSCPEAGTRIRSKLNMFCPMARVRLKYICWLNSKNDENSLIPGAWLASRKSWI